MTVLIPGNRSLPASKIPSWYRLIPRSYSWLTRKTLNEGAFKSCNHNHFEAQNDCHMREIELLKSRSTSETVKRILRGTPHISTRQSDLSDIRVQSRQSLPSPQAEFPAQPERNHSRKVAAESILPACSGSVCLTADCSNRLQRERVRHFNRGKATRRIVSIPLFQNRQPLV